jgi:tetratricopeptide (TPR) repeat protein
MHAELISKIAQVCAPLRVVSGPTMRATGNDKSATEIAHEVKADWLLEGAILRHGDRIRVTAMLIDASTDQERWSGRYDRELKDILFIYEEVAAEIAIAIQGELTPEQQQRVGQARVVDNDALLLYLKGRQLWNERTPEGIRAALNRYELAVEHDPSFASAYAGIADAYGTLGMLGEIPLEEAHPRAKAAALKALELNELLAEAHASLGNIVQNYEWDWARAEREYRRAIELNPSSSTAHLWLALLLAQSGRTDRSVQEATVASELDPLSMPATVGVGVCWYYGRQYDKAISSLLAAREIDPDYSTLYRVLAGAYLQRGNDAQAAHSLQAYFDALGDSTTAIGIGRLYEAGGIEGVARGMLAAGLAQREVTHVSAMRIAELYALLGDNDEALRWLGTGYDERDVDLNRLKVDPIFDGLRADPRFDELLNRPLFQKAWVTNAAG